MVLDTFGCTPKFLEENPKAAQAIVDSYFEALQMIKQDPKEELRDRGRGRQADGEQFDELGRNTSAGMTARRTRSSSRVSSQAFSKEAADLLLEIGIIKSAPDIASHRRYAFVK